MCLSKKPKFKNKFTLKEWSYIVKSHLRRYGIDLYKKPTFVGSFTLDNMRKELFSSIVYYEKDELSELFTRRWVDQQYEDYSGAKFTVLEWDRYGMLELHKVFEGSIGALKKSALLYNPLSNDRPVILKAVYVNTTEPEVIVYICDPEHSMYMHENLCKNYTGGDE